MQTVRRRGDGPDCLGVGGPALWKRICSVRLPEEQCQEVLHTVRALVPGCDLRYVTDEDGLAAFEGAVRSDVELQAVATMIWSILRPKAGGRR